MPPGTELDARAEREQTVLVWEEDGRRLGTTVRDGSAPDGGLRAVFAAEGAR